MSDLNAEVESAFPDADLAEQLLDARQARDNLFAMLVICLEKAGGTISFTRAELEAVDIDQALCIEDDFLSDALTISIYEE